MSTKNEIKQSQVIKRVLVELKTYRLQIVLSLICAVLTVIFTLLVPVLTGKAVDCMIGSGQIQWTVSDFRKDGTGDRGYLLFPVAYEPYQ